jgi:hypothetical protein
MSSDNLRKEDDFLIQTSGNPTPPSSLKSFSKSGNSYKKEPVDDVDTYVVSVPKGKKLPKKIVNKGASIRKVEAGSTIEEIVEHIDQIEKNVSEIVQNVNNITVNCVSCCVKFKTCFSARDVDANAELNTNVNVNARAHVPVNEMILKKNQIIEKK